jgi:hypothetical protein
MDEYQKLSDDESEGRRLLSDTGEFDAQHVPIRGMFADSDLDGEDLDEDNLSTGMAGLGFDMAGSTHVSVSASARPLPRLRKRDSSSKPTSAETSETKEDIRESKESEGQSSGGTSASVSKSAPKSAPKMMETSTTTTTTVVTTKAIGDDGLGSPPMVDGVIHSTNTAYTCSPSVSPAGSAKSSASSSSSSSGGSEAAALAVKVDLK